MTPKTLFAALFLLPSLCMISLGQTPSTNSQAPLANDQTPPTKEDQIALHSRLAEKYLQEKYPDLAIPELEKLVALDPDNIAAHGNLGVLLFFRGDYKAAIPHLQAALQAQPNLSKIEALLGFAQERTSDLPSAQKNLEASFPVIEDKKLKLEVGLDLLGIYNANSDLDDAAVLVPQLRKAFPDTPEVLYAAYRTYADLSGEAMLTLSLEAPDSAQMHQLLAHEEIREGNTNGAVAQFRKAIALNPRLPGVHFELAELLNTSQDPVAKKEAEQEYVAALAVNPQDEKSLCRLGEIAMAKGNTKKAFELFSRAVALQPVDSDAKLDLAKVLIQMNQLDKAQTLLEQTVQLDPTNATAHYRLATFYRDQGHIEDAKRQLEFYQNLRKEKDKLRDVYKDLLIQPAEIKAGAADEK